MAATVTLNDALQVFGKLSVEDQAMMIEIAQKRRIEDWRKDVAAYARKTRREHRAGKLKSVSRAELPAYLENLWKESDA